MELLAKLMCCELDLQVHCWQNYTSSYAWSETKRFWRTGKNKYVLPQERLTIDTFTLFNRFLLEGPLSYGLQVFDYLVLANICSFFSTSAVFPWGDIWPCPITLSSGNIAFLLGSCTYYLTLGRTVCCKVKEQTLYNLVSYFFSSSDSHVK